jgi:hypothetical protein
LTNPLPEYAEALSIAHNEPGRGLNCGSVWAGSSQATYDNDIFVRQSNAQSDFYFILAAAIA